MRLGGDTGEIGGELEGIVWEEMGRMGVQGAGRRAGRRPGGGAADAGEARGFRHSRNGLRPVGGGFWLLGKGSGGGGFGGTGGGMVQGAGRPQARRLRRRRGRSPCVSTQSKRPAAGGGYRKALPCMGKRISKTPKRPRSDVP